MSTTTIRMPEKLKMRVADAADRAGSTAHSYILEAISEKIEQDERRNQFNETADERYANILSSCYQDPCRSDSSQHH